MNETVQPFFHAHDVIYAYWFAMLAASAPGTNRANLWAEILCPEPRVPAKPSPPRRRGVSPQRVDTRLSNRPTTRNPPYLTTPNRHRTLPRAAKHPRPVRAHRTIAGLA